jgi:hypothetical protein
MIFDKIKLNYPNIWIKDADPERIMDIITSTIDRDYYTIDFTSGFSLKGNVTKIEGSETSL